MTATLRRVLAGIAFVLGVLQAWDSRVWELNALPGGLPLVLLAIVAVAMPAAALIVTSKPTLFVEAFALSLALLVVVRWVSPIPLPELFLSVWPAGVLFIVTGLNSAQDAAARPGTPSLR
ncbi:MAG TPA: hypothetical protein VM490_23160 [Armatimonadaceae bacterium]|nr:hypothetical protein [Armatimonadaceae bacterium]